MEVFLIWVCSQFVAWWMKIVILVYLGFCYLVDLVFVYVMLSPKWFTLILRLRCRLLMIDYLILVFRNKNQKKVLSGVFDRMT